MILERREGRGREREGNIDVGEKHGSVASRTCSDGGLNPQPNNLGLCSDLGSNLCPFNFQDVAPGN